jgi:hypothetical protein
VKSKLDTSLERSRKGFQSEYLRHPVLRQLDVFGHGDSGLSAIASFSAAMIAEWFVHVPAW